MGTWAAVATLALGSATLLYVMTRPPSLLAVVNRCTDRLIKNDTAGMFECSAQAERQQGLTEQNFTKAYRHVVLRALKESQILGPDTSANEEAGIGGAAMKVRNASGDPNRIGFQVVATPDGPRAVILRNLLYNAWGIEYQREFGSKDAFYDFSAAIYRGLRRDRRYLEALGLDGSISPSTGKYATWEDLEKGFRQEVEKAIRKGRLPAAILE